MVKSGDSFCLRILRFSHFCTLFVPKHHNSLIINAYYFLYRKVMRSWGGAAYLLHDIAFGKIYHIALRPEMPALARGFYMQHPGLGAMIARDCLMSCSTFLEIQIMLHSFSIIELS
jgi:hypothetical protein